MLLLAYGALLIYLGPVSLFSLIGLAVPFVLLPVISKVLSIQGAKSDVCSDKRVKLLTDVIGGIRALKAYAWENVFAAHVARIRSRQSYFLLKMNIFSVLAAVANIGFVGPMSGIMVLYAIHWHGYEGVPSDILFSYLFMFNFV